MKMRYFGESDASSLPVPGSEVKIPGDVAFWPKNHPIQEEGHREKYGLPPRDVKPPEFSDEEWEEIRAKPEDMMDPEPAWDRTCKGKCCEVNEDDYSLAE